MKKGMMLFLVGCLVVMFALPAVVGAQTEFGTDISAGLENVEGAGGLGDAPLTETINNIIGVFMGILGIIAVVLILMGGFKWMTAQGDEEKVKKAQKLITQGVAGLAVILAAYAIARFVVDQLVTATGGGA